MDPFDNILGFDRIYRFYDCIIGGDIPWRCGVGGDIDWLSFLLAGFTLAFIVINALIALGAIYTWFERRAIGRFQSRLGPNRWGPFGLLQPLADVIKLMTKEDTVPESADRQVFSLAPIVFLAPVLLVFAIIPFGSEGFLSKLNVGLLFIIGITSVNTIAIMMGGWSSRNKFALLGTMRGVAMLISYEVPMALALTGVVIMTGSLSLAEIVASQDLPFIIVQPLGFLVFIVAASAEMSRTPFDMIESESELIGGYNTEYSGMKFAIFQLAEFIAPLATAAIVTVLFLGGTRGYDLVPGQVWFVLKAFLVVAGLLWVRVTWPRLRVDQIMSFAWKALFPMALANMFLIAVEIQLLQDPSTGELSVRSMWIMASVNWMLSLVAIVAVSKVLGQPSARRSVPSPSHLANMYAGEITK